MNIPSLQDEWNATKRYRWIVVRGIVGLMLSIKINNSLICVDDRCFRYVFTALGVKALREALGSYRGIDVGECLRDFTDPDGIVSVPGDIFVPLTGEAYDPTGRTR